MDKSTADYTKLLQCIDYGKTILDDMVHIISETRESSRSVSLALAALRVRLEVAVIAMEDIGESG